MPSPCPCSSTYALAVAVRAGGSRFRREQRATRAMDIGCKPPPIPNLPSAALDAAAHSAVGTQHVLVRAHPRDDEHAVVVPRAGHCAINSDMPANLAPRTLPCGARLERAPTVRTPSRSRLRCVPAPTRAGCKLRARPPIFDVADAENRHSTRGSTPRGAASALAANHSRAPSAGMGPGGGDGADSDPGGAHAPGTTRRPPPSTAPGRPRVLDGRVRAPGRIHTPKSSANGGDEKCAHLAPFHGHTERIAHTRRAPPRIATPLCMYRRPNTANAHAKSQRDRTRARNASFRAFSRAWRGRSPTVGPPSVRLARDSKWAPLPWTTSGVRVETRRRRRERVSLRSATWHAWTPCAGRSWTLYDQDLGSHGREPVAAHRGVSQRAENGVGALSVVHTPLCAEDRPRRRQPHSASDGGTRGGTAVPHRWRQHLETTRTGDGCRQQRRRCTQRPRQKRLTPPRPPRPPAPDGVAPPGTRPDSIDARARPPRRHRCRAWAVGSRV
ncbi:hypothetical protein C2E23DRAFT_836158 [Lenzites betulinus]|nr:hypothetical protein C2E23DRAFT_836145 [Lenzites betulinus]KAH9850342.1 hypothetical protein C2E23DRAFT_836158 [Lenzites betulinus]